MTAHRGHRGHRPGPSVDDARPSDTHGTGDDAAMTSTRGSAPAWIVLAGTALGVLGCGPGHPAATGRPPAATLGRPPPAVSATAPTAATSSRPQTPPPSPTTVSPSSPPAPPTADQIAAQVGRTRDVADPAARFAAGPPVTVGDGSGGFLTAVSAGRTPSADGHGGLVFFWHDQTFLGWDTDRESWNVSLAASGPDAIEARYPDYARGDPACCPSLPPVTVTYRWTGTRLGQSRTLPPGVIVGILVSSH